MNSLFVFLLVSCISSCLTVDLAAETITCESNACIDMYLKNCSGLLCDKFCVKPQNLIEYSCGVSCTSIQIDNRQKCINYAVNCTENSIQNTHDGQICGPTSTSVSLRIQLTSLVGEMALFLLTSRHFFAEN